jgi:hypothetical protein
MDERVARAYESVAVAAKRLRPQLRFQGWHLDRGVRYVKVVGGTALAWANFLRALDHVAIAKADAEDDATFDDNGHRRDRPSRVGASGAQGRSPARSSSRLAAGAREARHDASVRAERVATRSGATHRRRGGDATLWRWQRSSPAATIDVDAGDVLSGGDPSIGRNGCADARIVLLRVARELPALRDR